MLLERLTETPLPFHEWIVLALQDERHGGFTLSSLGRLIEQVKIPKDHDKIDSAWRRACEVENYPADQVENVRASIAAQKSQAEAAATKPAGDAASVPSHTGSPSISETHDPFDGMNDEPPSRPLFSRTVNGLAPGH